jgi:hypothetical protein
MKRKDHSSSPWALGSASRCRWRPRRSSHFLLLSAALLIAAPASADKKEWLPIAPEDLALKANPTDPGAHAMVLYSETTNDLEKNVTSHYVRIKIFDQAGERYAEVEAEYGSGLFSLEGLRARTIHPDGSIVEFSGKPASKRKRTISGTTLIAAFTLPAVTPGSIIEYIYEVRLHRVHATLHSGLHPTASDITQMVTESRYFYWPVQGELFVRQARYSLHPRETLAPSTTGMRPAVPHYRATNLPPNTTLVTDKSGALTCEARDVPARPEEPFPPPLKKLSGRIEIYFNDHKPETREQFWGRYAGFLRDQESQDLESLREVRRVAEGAFLPSDPPETKLRKLYARAQQIRNLTFDPASVEKAGAEAAIPLHQAAEEVLKLNAGYSFDINMAFLALARAAGFSAEMMRLAPRNQQPFDADFFDVAQLAASAVWVHLNDKSLGLDPGTPRCPFGMLPWPKTLAGGFRLATERIVPVTTAGTLPRDSRIERKAVLQLSPGGALVGSLQADFYGQQALEMRIQALGRSEEEIMKMFVARFLEWLPGGSQIERLTAAGWDTDRDPLRVQCLVSIPVQAAADGTLAAPLTASVAGQPNPLPSPARVDAVSLPFLYQEADEIILELPPGAAVEQLPPAREASVRHPGEQISAPENGESTGLRRRQPAEVELWTYKNSRQLKGSSIAVLRTVVFGESTVSPEEYPKLWEFFQRVRTADTESVVVRPAPAVLH